VAETKGIVELLEGDILEFCFPGGGGVGQPSERDPQLVARDLRDGFVTREAAKVSYGVSG
jgi:N-methylhydantoinase B/oxoprolinase/acetone carboxylase alpha subunit